MNVLVTGGAGFIGSHLVERLLADGHSVTVFDRSASRHLDAVQSHPRLRLVLGDVRDPDALAKAGAPGTEAVFHLSAVVGVKHYVADPFLTLDVNVGGTRNALALAESAGARFLLASTSEVYGKNPKVPWSEDDDRVLGPTTTDRWSYSTSKALAEHMALAVHKARGLPVSVVRLFNVYGPRQAPDLVVSQTVRRVLRGEPALLYDGGRQTRCFTFVEDAVEGMLRAATRPDASGEVFNVGSERESTVREVVETVLRVAGSGAGWEDLDTAKHYGGAYEDIPRRVPDASKARRVLGWSATTPLEQGVRRTVEWARANPWWVG